MCERGRERERETHKHTHTHTNTHKQTHVSVSDHKTKNNKGSDWDTQLRPNPTHKGFHFAHQAHGGIDVVVEVSTTQPWLERVHCVKKDRKEEGKEEGKEEKRGKRGKQGVWFVSSRQTSIRAVCENVSDSN